MVLTPCYLSYGGELGQARRGLFSLIQLSLYGGGCFLRFGFFNLLFKVELASAISLSTASSRHFVHILTSVLTMKWVIKDGSAPSPLLRSEFERALSPIVYFRPIIEPVADE